MLIEMLPGNFCRILECGAASEPDIEWDSLLPSK
jgi:hypothetical protein